MVQSKAREKFIKLAESRVVKAIKDIRLIGNLSNKSNYSYDENDVKKIISALETEIKLLKKKFSQNEGKKEVIFKLE
jgi:transcription elongation GreA/GreB family factor